MNNNKNKEFERNMARQGTERSDEQLGRVSGGAVTYAPESAVVYPTRRWVVVSDNNGAIKADFRTKEAAEEWALSTRGVSEKVSDWSAVEKLRGGTKHR